MCIRLAPLASRIVTVPVGSDRSATADELAAACRSANPIAEVCESASFADAMERTACDRFVVVTGSLYLIGEALERLNLSPALGASERSLNEWGGVRHEPVAVLR